jgi:polyphosphate kinase
LKCCVPCASRDHKALLQAVLDIQWHDNVKARILDQRAAQQPSCRARPRRPPMRSQEAIHAYLATGKLPRLPRSNMTLPPKKRRKSR